ncbi:MAG: shikimate dehydrogenase [Moraxellaceae bacterium]|nr:MAG: shikimate dehydrogenase [Moraxellaceae bacterium]
MDRYAVMGNPIKHSKSPLIHKDFAHHSDQDMSYAAILVPADNFAETVRAFFADGGKGLNITVPFKMEAYQLADELSDRAQRAGAVNTLISLSDGRIRGDNTDGVGMMRDITNNHDGRITNKRILIVGAGGAVRGVLAPLLQENPASVTIVNRTVEKALDLADKFADMGRIDGCSYEDLPNEPYDWIINGTSASLSGELPPLPEGVIGEYTCCYDMMYSAEPTPFNRWAVEQGAAKNFDGAGMLVEQAAESFRLWRGVMPPTALTISTLKGAWLKGSAKG